MPKEQASHNAVKTLTPTGYTPRLIETRLDALMQAFGCVEITGAKWCGKTWTALSRAASAARLDSPSDRTAALVDPEFAFVGDAPHLVDEWQEVPEVWDAARRFVDAAGGARGLLLLTGSTSLRKDERAKVHHSGAGRIARIVMRPMTLAETGSSSGAVSLKALFAGEELRPTHCDATLDEIALWCCRGGWPAAQGLDTDAAFETPAHYIRSALDVNVMEEGRSPDVAYALMRALALNTSQAATHKTLRADMARGESDAAVSDVTLASYLELLGRLYLIEDLPGWEPPMRAKARVRVKPKRYFVDPSLAAALLGATPAKLLRDAQTLGLLFENLVLRDLRVFLSTYAGLGNSVSYYRDDKGLEVDFVVEHAGSWAGIEVKLSDAKVDDAAANLLALRAKVMSNGAARASEPAFLAVVVGKGGLAYRRPDGVCVIPIATLTA